MSVPPDAIAWMHGQSDATLRSAIAHAAGLLAAREGGYAPTTVKSLMNVAGRLSGRPVAEPRPHPSVSRPAQRPMAEILTEIATATGYSGAEIRGRGQDKHLSDARQWFMHEAWTARHSYPAIGRFLDNRDHTTIMAGQRAYALRSAERQARLTPSPDVAGRP